MGVWALRPLPAVLCKIVEYSYVFVVVLGCMRTVDICGDSLLMFRNLIFKIQNSLDLW